MAGEGSGNFLELDRPLQTEFKVENGVVPSPKRQSASPFQPHWPRKRRKGFPLALKAPLMVLNEKFGKILFEVAPSGDGSNAGFLASLSHNGEYYEGFGYSKSKAKTEAAKQMLSLLNIPFCEDSPMPPEPPQLSTSSAVADDFFSKTTGAFEGGKVVPASLLSPNHALELNVKRLQEMKIPFSLQRAAEYPAMVLNELFPNIQQNLEWLETDSTNRYLCRAKLAGETFYGMGVGKRAAKLKLAKSVLSNFFAISYFKSPNSALRSTSSSTLGKMHPYARVKWLDPNAKFIFEEVKDEEEQSLWKATVTIKGKEYTAVNPEKEKGKLQVAKLAFEKEHGTDEANLSMLVEKVIDTKKNPLQMFYEFYKSPEFMEDKRQNGSHVYFLVGINIDGQIYTASSLAKKRARMKLALRVFEKVHQISLEDWTMVKDDLKEEYLEDQKVPVSEVWQSEAPKMPAKEPMEASVAMKVDGATKVPKKIPADSSGKNPVSILYELHQDLTFMFSDENMEDSQGRFTCFITVCGKTFDSSGPNKKSAKMAAASRALEILYGIKNNVAHKPTNQSQTDITLDFADKVVNAVYAKFSQVFPSDIPCKVVASMVMAKEQNGGMLDVFEVLSMGTGTKCISGENLSHTGAALNDCHAEIIACRGFRQFIFDQLELALKCKESCLERTPGSNQFQMKPNLCLYLYINTAPCGDGRVYSNGLTSSNNKTIGMLRTKIENGQGECSCFYSSHQSISIAKLML